MPTTQWRFCPLANTSERGSPPFAANQHTVPTRIFCRAQLDTSVCRLGGHPSLGPLKAGAALQSRQAGSCALSGLRFSLREDVSSDSAWRRLSPAIPLGRQESLSPAPSGGQRHPNNPLCSLSAAPPPPLTCLQESKDRCLQLAPVTSARCFHLPGSVQEAAGTQGSSPALTAQG